MGKRREARERAVQFLFQYDLNPSENLDEALNHFWDPNSAPAIAEEKAGRQLGPEAEFHPPTSEEAAMRLFSGKLIRGTLEHRDELDRKSRSRPKLGSAPHGGGRSQHFAPGHLRNAYREDIPPIVSINEAVDIAKKFSTQDSGKFVNGLLDKIKGEISARLESSSIETKRMFADLHLHTQFSDGTFSPEELAQRGSTAGFRHGADGSRHGGRVRAHAQSLVWPAASNFDRHRTNCRARPREIHLLGYFIDIANKAAIGN